MGEQASKLKDQAQNAVNCTQKQKRPSTTMAPAPLKSAAEPAVPKIMAVDYKIGDRVVCLGTAYGRYEKGETGEIYQVNDQTALVKLDSRSEPIPIGFACFEHADGIEWELANKNKLKRGTALPTSVKRSQELEQLIQELFRKQDLNGNGVLEEAELIKLNQKISYLHCAKDDEGEDERRSRQLSVKENMTKLFRERLDVRGNSIVYPLFREYILHQLDDVDTDERAQVMIVEQWVAEAVSGREAFAFCSVSSATDIMYMPRTLTPD